MDMLPEWVKECAAWVFGLGLLALVLLSVVSFLAGGLRGIG